MFPYHSHLLMNSRLRIFQVLLGPALLFSGCAALIAATVPPGSPAKKITRAIGPDWPVDADIPAAAKPGKTDTTDDLLHQASTLVSQKKFDDALPLLQRAEKLDPQNYEVELLLGYVLQKVDKLGEAISAYRRALAIAPNNARGHSGLCRALAADDKRSDAIDECRKAVDLDPASDRYKAQLARLYMGEDRVQETIALMQSALESRPSDLYVLGTLADLYMLAGQYSAAAGIYETIARDHPDISIVYLRLTTAYDYLDRASDSIAAAKKFAAMQPRLPLAQLVLGDALKDAGYFDESLEPLKKATADSNLAGAAWTSLADVYKINGDPESELEALRQANKAEPDNIPVAFALGSELANTGHRAEAIPLLEKAYESDHSNPDFLRALSLEYLEGGGDRYAKGVELNETADRISPPPPNITMHVPSVEEHQKAIDRIPELEARLKAAPNVVDNYLYLIDAYQAKGGMDARIEIVYTKLVALIPNDYQAYNRFAIFYSENGHFDKALPFIKKAVELNPHHVLYMSYANDLARSGHLDEAVEALKKAVELKPDSPEVHLQLGELYKQLGRRNEALSEFLKMFELRSGDVRPNFRLAWLYIRMGDKEGALRHYKILQGITPNQVHYLERCILAHWGTLN